jgi:Zn-dependent protease
MRYTIGAGKYLGIPVRIHFTFPLILILFGGEAWLRGTWVDGLRAVAMIAAIFVCVVLHEFGHSLQVKRYGINVRDIVLLPIGGMARAERIPENPWQEIVVAISGPLVNFALVIVLFVALRITGTPFAPGESFVADLLVINAVLGTFNLVPAFPMDGGRILRGLLATRLPYLRATRYARAVGQVIALVFVVIGFLNSAFIMLPVIAVFIFFGAMSEENLIRARLTLDDRRVRDFVETTEVVSPYSTVYDVAKSTMGRVTEVAVSDDDRMGVGVVSGADLMFALAEGRGGEPVASIVRRGFPLIGADMSAVQAYYFLKAEHAGFAGVVEGGRFLGLVHFERLDEATSGDPDSE